MNLRKITTIFQSTFSKWGQFLVPKMYNQWGPVAVHPCVIDGQPYIIYPRGLKQQSPDVYKSLFQYFSERGYHLKEDRRSENAERQIKNQRRKLAPVLIFTASLLVKGTADAHETHPQSYQSNNDNQAIELHLLPNISGKQQFGLQLQHTEPIRNRTIDSQEALRLYQILLSKYQHQFEDPVYIIDDLRQIANYYSEFPEIISLIVALEDKNWSLTFREDDWRTKAYGNEFEVSNAILYFDTRSAAQLRLNNGCKDNPVCIASPADVMLHELLHVHNILVNTREFLAQGGMSNMLYPYRHEDAIIEQERGLYARMSMQDMLKRPYRFEHVGKAIKTSCPTCIN